MSDLKTRVTHTCFSPFRAFYLNAIMNNNTTPGLRKIKKSEFLNFQKITFGEEFKISKRLLRNSEIQMGSFP